MPTETINLLDANSHKNLSKIHLDWTLCLGAGICKGILPDWFDLTNKLVNRCYGFKWSAREFKKQTELVGFSLDSWIQGCLNQHILSAKGTIASFNEILEEELYRDLLENARKHKIRNAVIKLFEKPKSLNQREIVEVCDFFEKQYKGTSLMQLIKILLQSSDKVCLPKSIVTFNADSLLYSLLILFNIRDFNLGKLSPVNPKEPYRKITKPYQTWGNNVPIFHLHGSISPSLSSKKNQMIAGII